MIVGFRENFGNGLMMLLKAFSTLMRSDMVGKMLYEDKGM